MVAEAGGFGMACKICSTTYPLTESVPYLASNMTAIRPLAIEAAAAVPSPPLVQCFLRSVVEI